MTSSDTFQQEFEHEFKSELSELEDIRKKLLLKVSAIALFWGLLFLSALLFVTWKIYQIYIQEFRTSNDYEIIFAGIGLTLFFYFLAGLFLYKRRQKMIYKYLYHGAYAFRYKKELVEKAIPVMLNGFSYDAEAGIPRTDFTQSGFPLFSNPSRYYSAGAIKGKVGTATFTFAEVLAEEYIRDENSNGQYSDLFRGIFFTVDFNKNPQWNTLVYPDTVKYFSSFLLGKLSQEKHFAKGNYQRVKLEDVEFEKYFEVYGTDQTDSRYVLSTALMARIVDYRKKSKNALQFSFKGAKVYFGIYYPMEKTLFTPPLMKSVYDLSPLNDYIVDVRLMTDIVKELNLNSNVL